MSKAIFYVEYTDEFGFDEVESLITTIDSPDLVLFKRKNRQWQIEPIETTKGGPQCMYDSNDFNGIWEEGEEVLGMKFNCETHMLLPHDIHLSRDISERQFHLTLLHKYLHLPFKCWQPDHVKTIIFEVVE